MVKKLHFTGFQTALVLAGWLAFFGGFLIEDPSLKLLLHTVARVLPTADDAGLRPQSIVNRNESTLHSASVAR